MGGRCIGGGNCHTGCPALASRLESFTLPETNDYEYFPSFQLRGLTRLDVDVVPAGRS